MFDLKLSPDAVELLRKTISAVQFFDLDSVDVKVFPGELTMAVVQYRRNDLPRIRALLRIKANFTSDAVLVCPEASQFKVKLRALLRNLRFAAGGCRLHIHHVRTTDAYLRFIARNSIAEIFSEMQMDEVYDAERESVAGLAEVHVYKSIIGIPAEKFIEVLIHLSYFGYKVSVKATDTEVKFTTVNREVVFRNQPHGGVECFIGGVEPEHPIFFSINLYKPRVIVNACKLSSVVWFLYTDGPWPTMLNCPVGSLGNLMLYIAGVAPG